MGKDRSGGCKRSRKSSLESTPFSRFLEAVLWLGFARFVFGAEGGFELGREWVSQQCYGASP